MKQDNELSWKDKIWLFMLILTVIGSLTLMQWCFEGVLNILDIFREYSIEIRHKPVTQPIMLNVIATTTIREKVLEDPEGCWLLEQAITGEYKYISAGKIDGSCDYWETLKNYEKANRKAN